MRYLACALFLTLCASCTQKQTIEPAIALDRSAIDMPSDAADARLALTANFDWSVAPSSVPDWIVIEPVSGRGPREITLSARSNGETQERHATIAFVCGGRRAEVSVSQKGIEPRPEPVPVPEPRREPQFTRLNFFSYAGKYDYEPSGEGADRVWDFAFGEMVVAPGSRMAEKIFVGNVVNPRLASRNDVAEYSGYTYNPVTMFSLSGIRITESEPLIPSKAVQDDYARRIIDAKLQQSEFFRTDNAGEDYFTRRELHLIGMGNMGVALDEVFAGRPYRELEMTKKRGVIYSFSQSVFTIRMGFEEKFLLKEELSEADFPDGRPAYVGSVSYGRLGLLMIESDHEKQAVRIAVNKVVGGSEAELTAEDRAVLDELDACHVYYDGSGKMVVNKGKEDAIRAYARQMATFGDFYPFRFALTDYFTRQENFAATFRLQLP